MDCKKVLNIKVPQKEENIKVSEIAKKTLTFMAKNNIALTPKNYEDWFFVICNSVDDMHLLTDQNLFLLYEEYIKEKPAIFNDYDAKEVSKELKNIVNESENIITLIDTNINKHSQFMEDSKKALEKKDIKMIDDLKNQIKILEEENKKLKKKLYENRYILNSLEDKFHEYKKLSYIDPLTGLFNRRAFNEEVEKIKDIIPFSIIYLDIDDFKKINDTYGHTVGDEVLKEIGEILNSFIRKDTKAFRLGGEEFAIILPNVNIEDAKNIAQRIRKVIENHNIKLEDTIVSYTASFGITSYQKGEDINELLKRADEAMYQAKKSGKNRVFIL
ncbi:GGDEF domain-containing protein [Nitrosophilus kaiyonis]|uniref:GGDEF domain-containing protein n=1 Tax=Nitrosophilus kaiyonis TaxID=2930200 RepID=UPI0024933239|nr:GGDEF domain-containing protein [Nitrosophilus kaiyonis]